jgi:hypothetical protein
METVSSNTINHSDETTTSVYTLEELSEMVDEFVVSVGSATPDINNSGNLDQFFSLKRAGDQLEHALENYENSLEDQYRAETISREECRNLDREIEKLEENNNTLTGFSNIYDIAKHGHICEIDLYNTENINEYYVVKDDISVCESKQLIPKAFLEAIKVQNFSLAKRYLNDSLCKASNSHFKTYFGTIQSIYYNAYNNSNPVNYTVYNGEYKSYNFKVCDNKICDIEECKLYTENIIELSNDIIVYDLIKNEQDRVIK